MQVKYQEEKLSSVIAHYVEGYKLPVGQEIYSYEFYIKDDKLLIKLVIKEENE